MQLRTLFYDPWMEAYLPGHFKASRDVLSDISTFGNRTNPLSTSQVFQWCQGMNEKVKSVGLIDRQGLVPLSTDDRGRSIVDHSRLART